MKIIKRFFSFFLGSLMLVTGTNVLAGGNDKEDSKSPEVSKALPVINVAVVGDDDEGKENFIKSYTEIKGDNYYGVQSYKLKYEGQIIKFFDIPSDLGAKDKIREKWINKFLKSSKRNRDVPYCTHVIICLDVKNEKDKLLKRTHDWLTEVKSRNKYYQMLLVLYTITDENYPNNDDIYEKTNAVVSKLGNFEYEFLEQNPGIRQFRTFVGFPKGGRFVLNIILRDSDRYVSDVNEHSSILESFESSIPLVSIITAIWDIFLVVGIVVYIIQIS